MKETPFGPEGPDLELKREARDPASVARTLIAFANGRGGRLVIGVDSRTAEIVGVPPGSFPDLEEWLCNVAYDRCAPVIRPHITAERHGDKLVVVVRVFPGNLKPYHLKGHDPLTSTYIRVGSTNRLADEATVRSLERESLNVPYDEVPVVQAEYTDLDHALVRRYLEQRRAARGTPLERASEAVILKLRAAVRHNGRVVPTVGGILLFGKEPQRFFPHARIRCARFKGSTVHAFLDQAEVTGSLLDQVDEALSFVLRNIRWGAVIEGTRRKERPEYPIEVLREAIVNAVVHRDYSIEGADIRVAVFDDLIEITSPGLLPAGVSIEQLGTGVSEIRNRVIARVFNHVGLAEEWGRGTRLMKDAMRSWGLPPPEFQEVGREFRVVLRGPGEQWTGEPGLGPRQQRLLAWAVAKGSVTNREYREMFGVSAVTAHKELRALVRRGLLRVEGRGRNTRYVPV